MFEIYSILHIKQDCAQESHSVKSWSKVFEFHWNLYIKQDCAQESHAVKSWSKVFEIHWILNIKQDCAQESHSVEPLSERKSVDHGGLPCCAPPYRTHTRWKYK